jgi:hypothetical protein
MSFMATQLAGFGSGGGIGGNDAFTKLLLHCDGADASTTITDSSSSARTITAVGNAQIDTAQSKFGGASLLHDGTGDYVTAPDSADWDLDADLTVDLWHRFNSVVQTILVGNYLNAGTGWTFQYRTDTTALRFMNGDSTIFERSWSPSTNTWYHIAVIRTGSTMRFFIDGTQLGTDATSATSFSGSTVALSVGGSTVLGAASNGWFDEVRVSKGVARWTANFTPPIEPYSL